MLQILDLPRLVLLLGAILAIITTLGIIVWGHIRSPVVPKRPDPPSEETKGPFTRPSAPANPSVLDHSHMRSGTIYEVRKPETEGFLPVRTEAAPGVIVQTLSLQESEPLFDLKEKQEPKVNRKNRYHRSPVI